MKHTLLKRAVSLLTASGMAAALTLSAAMPADAENFLFITEITLESGENAYETLEAAGYNVMAVGLNADVDVSGQIYLGYKYNTGAPITNILISGDAGSSLEQNGILYECASHTDVDTGNGGGAGCIYVTHDERAGTPLVGLDILKADAAEEQELLPIPNDGAEVVRKPDGTPCDIEAHSETVTMYLAQIRDGLVAPYISEIMPVTDTTRWDAIYTAAERGFNYFIDGDIDDRADTYTLIAYKRTADASQAITGIAAVSAEMIRSYEANQMLDTIEASETEPVPSDEGTSSAELGLFAAIAAHAEEPSETESERPEEIQPEETEPESMTEETDSEETTAEETASEGTAAEETEPESTEAESLTDETNAEPSEESAGAVTEAPTKPETSLTGDAIGISGVEYFRTSRTEVPGEIPYYLYASKDERAGNPVMMLYAEELNVAEDTLFGMWAYSYFSVKGSSNAYSYICNEDPLLAFQSDMTVCTNRPILLLGTETPEDINPVIRLTMLTAKDGLPESLTTLGGLRTPTYVTPQLDRENRSDRKNKFPASVFGEHGALALILGGVAVAGAAAAGIVLRKTRKKSAKKR